MITTAYRNLKNAISQIPEGRRFVWKRLFNTEIRGGSETSETTFPYENYKVKVLENGIVQILNTKTHTVLHFQKTHRLIGIIRKDETVSVGLFDKKTGKPADQHLASEILKGCQGSLIGKKRFLIRKNIDWAVDYLHMNRIGLIDDNKLKRFFTQNALLNDTMNFENARMFQIKFNMFDNSSLCNIELYLDHELVSYIQINDAEPMIEEIIKTDQLQDDMIKSLQIDSTTLELHWRKGYNKLLRFISIIVAKILNQNYLFSAPINKISTFTLLKHFKNCRVFRIEPPKKLTQDETKKLFINVLHEFEANYVILVPVDDNLAAAIEFVKQWKIKQ